MFNKTIPVRDSENELREYIIDLVCVNEKKLSYRMFTKNVYDIMGKLEDNFMSYLERKMLVEDSSFNNAEIHFGFYGDSNSFYIKGEEGKSQYIALPTEWLTVSNICSDIENFIRGLISAKTLFENWYSILSEQISKKIRPSICFCSKHNYEVRIYIDDVRTKMHDVEGTKSMDYDMQIRVGVMIS